MALALLASPLGWGRAHASLCDAGRDIDHSHPSSQGQQLALAGERELSLSLSRKAV